MYDDKYLGQCMQSLWNHTNLLIWGPFKGAINKFYLTLKKGLLLQSFNAVIYQKKVILPSGEGKTNHVTQCSGKSWVLLKKLKKGRFRVYFHWEESIHFGSVYEVLGNFVYSNQYIQESHCSGKVICKQKIHWLKPWWLLIWVPFLVAA